MTWKKRTPAANRRRRRRYERDRAWVLRLVTTKGPELASRVISMIGYLGIGPPSQRPPKERASVRRRRLRRELYDDRAQEKLYADARLGLCSGEDLYPD